MEIKLIWIFHFCKKFFKSSYSELVQSKPYWQGKGAVGLEKC